MRATIATHASAPESAHVGEDVDTSGALPGWWSVDEVWETITAASAALYGITVELHLASTPCSLGSGFGLRATWARASAQILYPGIDDRPKITADQSSAGEHPVSSRSMGPWNYPTCKFFDFIGRHRRMIAMGTTPSDSAADDTGTPDEQPEEHRIEVEDQRAHLRFDKMFVVRLESLLFGEIYCVARNVSAGGIFLELPDPLPLGAAVRVCFPVPDGSGDVVASGEVKNHYFINYTQGGTTRAVAGMAVRFTSFENESHHVLADCLSRMRVLH